MVDTSQLGPEPGNGVSRRVSSSVCIPAEDIRWTVSSLDVSPDSAHLMYTTLCPVVHLVELAGLREHLYQRRKQREARTDSDDGAAEGSEDADGASRAARARVTRSRAAGAAAGHTSTGPPRVKQQGFDLSGEGSAYSRFGVYQARFGSGGSDVVAGCSDNCVRVADVERRVVTATVRAHADDINAVCFLDDRSKSNVLMSGSDDCTIRVWDLRTVGTSEAAASAAKGPVDGQIARYLGSAACARADGYLVGHTEGITSLSSRNDGFYVASNGKDNCCKLWDVRKMASHAEISASSSESAVGAHHVQAMRKSSSRYDYRWMAYPRTRSPPSERSHPGDLSIMTYRGHVVKQTLIRAHFTPPASTGGCYIVSGSADGRVFIYDVLSGEGDAVAILGARGIEEDCHANVVREAVWHPRLPLIASASFDGSVAVWGWGGSELAAQHAAQRRHRLQWREAIQRLAAAAPARPSGDSEEAAGGGASDDAAGGPQPKAAAYEPGRIARQAEGELLRGKAVVGARDMLEHPLEDGLGTGNLPGDVGEDEEEGEEEEDDDDDEDEDDDEEDFDEDGAGLDEDEEAEDEDGDDEDDEGGGPGDPAPGSSGPQPQAPTGRQRWTRSQGPAPG